MEYVTSTAYYPGAFTDCEAAILRTVNRMGLWLVSQSDLNFDQLRALLTLRNLGYVEYGAYGGYRVKDNHTRALAMKDVPPPTPAPIGDIARITAALASAGITPKQPIVEAKGATKRPGPKPSYAIVVPSGVVIPANVWELFEGGAYRNGNLIVVQLKVG